MTAHYEQQIEYDVKQKGCEYSQPFNNS